MKIKIVLFCMVIMPILANEDREKMSLRNTTYAVQRIAFCLQEKGLTRFIEKKNIGFGSISSLFRQKLTDVRILLVKGELDHNEIFKIIQNYICSQLNRITELIAHGHEVGCHAEVKECCEVYNKYLFQPRTSWTKKVRNVFKAVNAFQKYPKTSEETINDEPEEDPEEKTEGEPKEDTEEKIEEEPKEDPEEKTEELKEKPEEKIEEEPKENLEEKIEEPKENPEGEPKEDTEEKIEEEPKEDPDEKTEELNEKPEEKIEEEPKDNLEEKIEEPKENPEEKIEKPKENPEEKIEEKPEEEPKEKSEEKTENISKVHDTDSEPE